MCACENNIHAAPMNGLLCALARISGLHVKAVGDVSCSHDVNLQRDSKPTSPNTNPMNNHPPKKPHIVFYFSDTGGGHRSAAEAIIEAIHIEYKDQVTT